MRIVMYILSVIFVGLYVGGTVYEVDMMKLIMDHSAAVLVLLTAVLGFLSTVQDLLIKTKKKKKTKKKIMKKKKTKKKNKKKKKK